MASQIALLRGINVGGHRKVPMAQLRALAEELGFANVRTYVASGNLVFDGEGTGAALEARLEQAIERTFGFPVDVIVRSGAQWAVHVRANPMKEERDRHPYQVMMMISKEAPAQADVDALARRASPNERVALAGKAI